MSFISLFMLEKNNSHLFRFYILKMFPGWSEGRERKGSKAWVTRECKVNKYIFKGTVHSLEI